MAQSAVAARKRGVAAELFVEVVDVVGLNVTKFAPHLLLIVETADEMSVEFKVVVLPTHAPRWFISNAEQLEQVGVDVAGKLRGALAAVRVECIPPWPFRLAAWTCGQDKTRQGSDQGSDGGVCWPGISFLHSHVARWKTPEIEVRWVRACDSLEVAVHARVGIDNARCCAHDGVVAQPPLRLLGHGRVDQITATVSLVANLCQVGGVVAVTLLCRWLWRDCVCDEEIEMRKVACGCSRRHLGLVRRRGGEEEGKGEARDEVGRLEQVEQVCVAGRGHGARNVGLHRRRYWCRWGCWN